MESSVQFICIFCGSLSDEYGCPCSTCKLCGNEAHYGYDCPSQVLFVYNQDPCFNQNLDNFPQTSPSFPQQYLCCEDCGGPHATFQCQPMNQSFYNYNSSGFDQIQPPQYFVVRQPPQETSEEILQARETLMEAIQAFLKNFIYHDDDNDDDDYHEESILSMNTDMVETPSPDAIMTSSPIEEPKDSLIMEDEDINTIPKKESDEENESSVENLFHIPSESKVTSDNESECDLPNFDDSPLDVFVDDCVIFSRPLFDSYGDTTSSEYSSNDESILEEDVFSNLPFKFNVESISSDIDPILEEFADELALINPIPPGIDKVDFDHEGDSLLVEKLSYDNSSPRPSKELNSKNIIEFVSAFPIPVEDIDFLLKKINTIFSYFDDSLPELETFSLDIEETNSGSTTTHFDYSFLIYEKFSFHDDPTEEKNSGSTIIHAKISPPEYESFNHKSEYVSEMFNDEPVHIMSPREYDYFYFDIEPDPGELTTIVVEDIFREPRVPSFPSGNRNKTFDPGISIEVQSKRFLSLNTFPISFISDPLSLVLETLLLFSSGNEDKVFNPGILISKEERSLHLLSHRGFKAFKIIHNFLNESLMMIYGEDIPI
ncbi:hypothetical protein Tco_1276210 [Tanacetum coccineum]